MPGRPGRCDDAKQSLRRAQFRRRRTRRAGVRAAYRDRTDTDEDRDRERAERGDHGPQCWWRPLGEGPGEPGAYGWSWGSHAVAAAVQGASRDCRARADGGLPHWPAVWLASGTVSVLDEDNTQLAPKVVSGTPTADLRFARTRCGHDGRVGTRVIDRLAADLRAAFPDMRGLSRHNFIYMRTFAAAYPQLTAQQAVAQLPWGHFTVLLDKLEVPAQRDWYANAAVQ